MKSVAVAVTARALFTATVTQPAPARLVQLVVGGVPSVPTTTATVPLSVPGAVPTLAMLRINLNVWPPFKLFGTLNPLHWKSGSFVSIKV